MVTDRSSLGQRPRSAVLRKTLADLVDSHSASEVIVHHFTDTPRGLQMEVELRVCSFSEGVIANRVCSFKRIILP